MKVKYCNYDIDDLLNDSEFINWVHSPTQESETFWANLFRQYPELEEKALEGRRIYTLIHFNHKEANQETMDRVLGKILTDNYSGSYKKLTKTRKIQPIQLFSKIAATLLVSLVFAFIINHFSNEVETDFPTTNIVTKENVNGQKSTILLPDSSVVTLNSNSKIQYSSDFIAHREVDLQGEAFFEVQHKKDDRPFIVKTGEITTRVLGTSFNIRSFSKETTSSVALSTGKIIVETKHGNDLTSTALLPGEKLVFNKESGTRELKPLDNSTDLAWKEGILVFKETPFDEVIDRLEQWYGVKITIKNKPSRSKPVTGWFDNEYLTNVLNSISYTVRFEYEIKDKNVLITFK